MEIIDMKIFSAPNIYSNKKIAYILAKCNLHEATTFANKAIELQKAIGYNLVEFSSIQEVDNLFEIMIEHDNKRIIKEVILQCLNYINKKNFDLNQTITPLKRLTIETEMSPNMRLLKNACQKRGIRFQRIGESDICILGEGKYSKVFYGFNSDVDISRYMICSNRETQKEMLKAFNFPTPPWRVVYTSEQFEEAIKELGFPLAIKSTSHKPLIYLNIRTLNQAIEYYNQIKKEDNKVLVERFINGSAYKILVMNNKVVSAIKISPPHIIGNGKYKIIDLLEDKDKEDKLVQKTILKQGFTLDSVLPKDFKVYLREVNNIKNGLFMIEDVTDKVHPQNQHLFCDVVDKMGLNIAVIDYISEDISINAKIIGSYIINVELDTDLRLFQQNCNVDVFGNILDIYFEKMPNPSIPIITATGQYGKSTTLSIINYILKRVGLNVSITSDIQSLYTKLLNDNSDIKLLEIKPNKEINEIDFLSNIVILTNTKINDDEALKVQKLIIKSVKENGYVILSADDIYKNYYIANDNNATFVLTSRDKNHPDIKAWIGNKRPCVFIDNDEIIIYENENRYNLCQIEQIPYSYNGRINFAVDNILQAVAALYFYGVDIEIISKYIKEYRNDSHQNPGKFNIFDINGIKVCIDSILDNNVIQYIINALTNIGIQNIICVCDERDKLIVDNSIHVISKKINNFNDILILMGQAMKLLKKGDAMLLLLKEPYNIDITHEIRERLINKRKVIN
ncbi:Mur ligase [Caldicellulosiruptoraceae bacterium PP1]